MHLKERGFCFSYFILVQVLVVMAQIIIAKSAVSMGIILPKRQNNTLSF